MSQNYVPPEAFATFLRTVDEEPLYPPLQNSPTTYRLIEEPAFAAPSVHRVSKTGIVWEVFAKITDGLGGYFTGKVAWKTNRRLNTKESKRLDQILLDLDFWTMPVIDSRPALVDGSNWTLEGVDAGEYHLVSRSLPQEWPLLELGNYLSIVSGAAGYQCGPEARRRQFEAFRIVEAAVKSVRPEPFSPEGLARLNKISAKLAVRIADQGLRCPHYRTSTRRIRFIDKSPQGKSYFICKICFRSFGPEQLETGKVFKI